MEWRLETTVLTDLSASIFAACFMILLIFIGLAQKEQVSPRPGEPRPIEATRDLAATLRTAAAPADMVDRLFRHGAAGAAIARADLFADRIVLRAAGSDAPVPLAPGRIGSLAAGFGTAGAPPILYVFSNALYGEALAALGGRPHLELSVPRGLRDAARPDRAWSQAFTDLGAGAHDIAAFRAGLATLLAGSPEPAPGPMPAADGAPRSALLPEASEPPAGMWREVLRRLSVFATLAGFAAAAAIRYRLSDVAFATSGRGGGRLG